MTEAGLAPTHAVQAMDEFGDTRELHVAGEFPLTIKVDEREIVTLMTLGTNPELLTLGYLRNQRMLERIEDVAAVEVDWEREQVNVTHHARARHRRRGGAPAEAHRDHRLRPGHGVLLHAERALRAARAGDRSSASPALYGLLENIAAYNEIYKRAGAVHGCALCRGTEILTFVEDVGRHNAADAISGHDVAGRHRRRRQDLLHHRAPDLGDRHEGGADGDPGAAVALRASPTWAWSWRRISAW